MKANRKKIVRYTVIFLLVMLFFTIISNKVNFMMMPEVLTVSPAAGRLSYEITASGRYGDGGVVFWVNLEKEAYINTGDRPTAEFSNIKERLRLVVGEKVFNESTQMAGYVCRFEKTPEQSVYEGQSCIVRFSYEIGKYDMVLPKDCVIMEGTAYVYRLDTVGSVLGESTVVRKLEVTVLAEDDYNVAISGGINARDRIVRYFTKPLRNEQKVRASG